MRFARFAALPNQRHRGLGDAVAAAGVQLLQLDFGRHAAVEASALDDENRCEFAPAFAQQLLELRKPLFLEQDFCLVTNAGWDNALFCVEGAAQVMVESGNDRLLMSAVRGSNLLPILDYLVQDGIDLSHADTGRPFAQLNRPVLAAELELGGGPFAMALAEGARIIVAGCYDATAPLCAKGVADFQWSWSDYDRLAGAAAAAHAATWPTWHAAAPDSRNLSRKAASPRESVELEPDGGATISFPGAVRPNAAPLLEAWLRRRHGEPPLRHSDVACDFAAVACRRCSETQLQIDGAAGIAADHRWRLNIVYQSGFAAEALIAADGDETSYQLQQLVDHLRELLGVRDADRGEVDVAAWGGVSQSRQFISLTCRSLNKAPCDEFVADVSEFAASNRDAVALVGGAPRVHATSQVWPARVPRHAIDLAVDTRPAHDWV